MASTNFEDLVLRDTRANQPAAGVPGRLYYVTDEGVTERDNGSSWDDCSDSPDGGAPGGSAGGDLSGTYPNPSVAKVGGVAVTVDTDGTLAANSDAKLATQKATKTYVDAAVTGLFEFKGSTNCSANPNYPAASKGDAYVVTNAGKIGGASGKSVDVGDVYVASADNAGGTEASVGTSWFVLEHNLIGALLAANNLSDLASASTARTNLGLGTAAVLDTGTGANQVVKLSSSPGTPDGTKFLRDDMTFVVPSGGGGGSSVSDAYILIRDEKASGTGGGTSTSGSYQTRDLNTEVHDAAGLASIASNQITLAAGTYRCRIVVPGFRIGDHKAKLYNVSDSADVIIGTSALAQTGANTTTSYSFIVGRFTIASTKVFEVRHRCSSTQASNGFGTACVFGDVEVYTIVELWKEQ